VLVGGAEARPSVRFLVSGAVSSALRPADESRDELPGETEEGGRLQTFLSPSLSRTRTASCSDEIWFLSSAISESLATCHRSSLQARQGRGGRETTPPSRISTRQSLGHSQRAGPSEMRPLDPATAEQSSEKEEDGGGSNTHEPIAIGRSRIRRGDRRGRRAGSRSLLWARDRGRGSGRFLFEE
jgi:hypothetical protein